MLDCVKPRANTLPEMVHRARFFFPGPAEYEPHAVASYWKDKPAAVQRLRRLRATLEDLTDWGSGRGPLEAQILAIAELMDIGAGKLIHPLRLALGCSELSAGTFEVMHLLVREFVSQRIDDAIAHRGDA